MNVNVQATLPSRHRNDIFTEFDQLHILKATVNELSSLELLWFLCKSF